MRRWCSESPYLTVKLFPCFGNENAERKCLRKLVATKLKASTFRVTFQVHLIKYFSTLLSPLFLLFLVVSWKINLSVITF